MDPIDLIQPLEGESNYDSWSRYVEYTMQKENLFTLVNGTEQPPVLPDRVDTEDGHAEGDLIKVLDLQDADYQKQLENFRQEEAEYKRRTQRAKDILFGSVTPDVAFADFADFPQRTPKEMWDILKAKYSENSSYSVFEICKMLSARSSYNNFGNLSEYSNHHRRWGRELASRGHPLSDTIAASLHILGLPDEYRKLGMLAVTYADVESRDMKFEQVVSFVTRCTLDLEWPTKRGKRIKGSAKAEDVKEVVKCYNCGKEGHLQKDCRLLGRERKRQRTRNN